MPRKPGIKWRDLAPEVQRQLFNGLTFANQCKEFGKLSKEVQAEIFIEACQSKQIPVPTPELRFNPPRRHKADYAWPEHGVVVEQEGGIYSGGRHVRGKGYHNDMQKYNTYVTKKRWWLLRYTPEEMLLDETLEEIAMVIEREAMLQQLIKGQ